jgi:hypothetical protein
MNVMPLRRPATPIKADPKPTTTVEPLHCTFCDSPLTYKPTAGYTWGAYHCPDSSHPAVDGANHISRVLKEAR